MSEKTKVKKAFAEAILQQLWVEGLITMQERERITQRATESIANGKC